MDNSKYVKHPTIPLEDFDGKWLAYCREDGTFGHYQLRILKRHPSDGSYVLARISKVLTGISWQPPAPTDCETAIEIDQDTVSKICRINEHSSIFGKCHFQTGAAVK